jgi:hypothetical protein
MNRIGASGQWPKTLPAGFRGTPRVAWAVPLEVFGHPAGRSTARWQNRLRGQDTEGRTEDRGKCRLCDAAHMRMTPPDVKQNLGIPR